MRPRHHLTATPLCALVAVVAVSGIEPGHAAPAAPLRAPSEATAPAGLLDGKLILRPSRFETTDVRPGQEYRFELVVTNTVDEPVRIEPRVIPIDGAADPDRFAEPGSASSRSAAAVDWASFPGFDEPRELGPDRQLTIPVSVKVPRGSAPGSYVLGLGVAWNTSALGVSVQDSPAGRVDLDAIPVAPAVLRVPGKAVARARIDSVDGPRFVWGGGRPTFRTRVENAGETDLVIDSQVELEAFLGSAGRTLSAAGPDEGYPTLPGGVRVLRMAWGDPPLFGWFRPTLVVVGGEGSGVRVTKRLDTVYVLPPWWLVLLLVLAVWLPVRTIRRRARRAAETGEREAKVRSRIEERRRREQAKARARAARRGE